MGAVRFELEGNSPGTINSVAWLCLLGLLLAVVLGCLLDRSCERAAEERASGGGIRGPPGFAIFLLVASYALLLPGLYSTLFSFNIMIDFNIVKLGLGPGGGIDKAPAITESMMGLLKLLQKAGAETGANAVMLYAMIIPTVKLVLLVLGQALRCFPLVASCCTRSVQVISKWACPDMFAYILLMHVIRGMNHPSMLRSEMQLDLGFTCFSLFCIGSTLASLGLRAEDLGSSKLSWRGPCRWLEGEAIMLVVMLLFVGFLWTFQSGLCHPVMSLRIYTDVLYKPTGPIPEQFYGVPTRPVIDSLKIPEKANADVSLLAAMMSLKEAGMKGGEVNSIIGLVMIAFFVVVLTSASMFLLLVIAFMSRCGQETDRLLRLAAALKKLSMLDVLIMGITVVTMCMRMYRKDGIVVTAQPGLYSLVCAELLHYATYFLVTWAPERFRGAAADDAAAELEGSESQLELNLLPKELPRGGEGP